MTEDEDTIERMAQAIYERHAEKYGAEHPWETIRTFAKRTADEYRADARAAFNALATAKGAKPCP